MTICKDCMKPSPKPDSCKIKEIFSMGIFIGTYLALVTFIFYWVVIETNFFEVCNTFLCAISNYLVSSIKKLEVLTRSDWSKYYSFCLCFWLWQIHFKVRSLSSNTEENSSAIHLQVSIISQALIFATIKLVGHLWRDLILS